MKIYKHKSKYAMMGEQPIISINSSNIIKKNNNINTNSYIIGQQKYREAAKNTKLSNTAV